MQQRGGFSGETKPRKGLIILIFIFILLVLGVLYFMGVFNRVVRNVRAVKLRCAATQDIQPFGDSLLYYDGSSLVCLGSNGSERWNYMVGSGANEADQIRKKGEPSCTKTSMSCPVFLA